MGKITSLTIAIPAYNEALNIRNILYGLMKQDLKELELQEISVYSDGSDDKTVEIVREIQKENRALRIIDGKERLGKIIRLNQIFKENKSEVLIILDADIGLVGKDFIYRLTQALLNDHGAQMVSAHQEPLRPKGLIGRIMFGSFTLWDYIRFSVPNYDHVQNFYGAATAYRKPFAASLHIPDNATEERVYIYMMAKKNNGFRYCRSAKIIYWPVTTFHDFLKLSDRSFGTRQPELEKLFGPEVNNIHLIPWKYKVIGILKSFYHQPIYTPLTIFFGFLLSRMTTEKSARKTALWEIALSTKRPILSHE